MSNSDSSDSKICQDIRIDPSHNQLKTERSCSAAWNSSSLHSVYIPLIGNLDDCSTSSESSKFNQDRHSTSQKTAPSIDNHGNQTSKLNQDSSPFNYKLKFRRLLSSYSPPTKIQSWQEFLDTTRMKTPTSANQIKRRFLENLQYFQGNYLCIFAILFIYCILTSPLLLLAIALICGALYFVTVVNHRHSSLLSHHHQDHTGNNKHRLAILGIEPTLQQQYTIITLFALPLLWVSGAPSAVFWVS